MNILCKFSVGKCEKSPDGSWEIESVQQWASLNGTSDSEKVDELLSDEYAYFVIPPNIAKQRNRIAIFCLVTHLDFCKIVS